jgi:sugar lactone lactonase YvrE
VDVWAGKSALVTTLAGDNQAYADGTGTAAKFIRPAFAAVLPNGNIIVADQASQNIRLVTIPGGVVTTLAGQVGAPGFSDGTGTAARFTNPSGVGVLQDGTIVISDYSNHRLRLVTLAGVVTTLAGQATAASVDGTGAAAQFNLPYGIAVLPDGNIAVAEIGGHRVRLVTPAGVVTTVAGSSTQGSANGTGAGAQFISPYGVAALPNGNIVVADTGNHRIRLITMPGAVVTTLAGSSQGSTNGTGTAAQFNTPAGVAVLPNGNIVVAEFGSHRIRLITMPGAIVTTLAGNSQGYGDGTGTAASFNGPMGVTVLPSGVVVVVEYDNFKIRLITPT